jgi:hypothetical protein
VAHGLDHTAAFPDIDVDAYPDGHASVAHGTDHAAAFPDTDTDAHSLVVSLLCLLGVLCGRGMRQRQVRERALRLRQPSLLPVPAAGPAPLSRGVDVERMVEKQACNS